MKIIPKKDLNKEIKEPGDKFDPGLALIDLRTTGPRPSWSWTHDLRDSGTVPYQLSWQAQLELEA